MDRQIIDVEECRRAFGVLADPAHWCELRPLPTGGSKSLLGGDVEALCMAVDGMAYSDFIYYAINPIKSGELRANKDTVVKRRWFLLDIDPVRPPDCSATDAEKEAAATLAATVIEHLSGRGWPVPVLIDSGNGYHLLYRVDLPNDRLTAAIVKAATHALAKLSTPEASIDKAVHDAPRIAKLPGTWSRKGLDTPERPWRMCRLMHVPESVEVVPVELLQAVGGNEKPAEPKPMPETRSGAYGRKALEGERMKVLLASQGQRNDALNKAAFALGQLVGGGVLSRVDVEAVLTDAGISAGLGESEVGKTVRSGLEAGGKEPRTAPERNGQHSDGTAPAVPLTICAASVTPRKVEWLWPGRVPKGFVTVFAGRTGLGKSFVTCDMVARITKGLEIPFGEGECFEQGGTLLISEDPHDFMLTPRLIELGADLNFVQFMTWEAMAKYSLGDTEVLGRACAEVRQPKLVVIDPPTNFLGEADEHRNAEIRMVLMKIVAWLQEVNVACVFIMHVNKAAGKGVEAVSRVLGSVAWVSTSRIAHTFSPDSGDPDLMLFLPMKNNLGPLTDGLSYRIVSTSDLARVDWVGKVDITADEAMNSERRSPRQVLATDWLIEIFSKKLEYTSDEFWSSAKMNGVSKNAIDDARVTLEMPKPRFCHGLDGNKTWTWWVPKDWPPICKSPGDSPESGDLGDLEPKEF